MATILNTHHHKIPFIHNYITQPMLLLQFRGIQEIHTMDIQHPVNLIQMSLGLNPYQPAPIQPTSVPAAMSYPNVMPTAPHYPGQPSVAPTQPYVGGGSPVEWIPTTPRDAASLSNKAIIAGYEGYDRSPLWVIRARYEGDLIPGKLAIKHHAAYVPWGGNENAVQNIEVCCAPPERVRWVECRDGVIPPNAVVGGNTSSGEPLYVGRAKEQGSLTPGKVHPSHKGMYISFAGKEIAHKIYEILCHA
uniref:Similar to CG10527 n=1 Tax=Papilio xuthus TaxID=66420 RepID=I4DK80_PAPXU|nr:uncharacterized protein LOC106122557 [Papilio xuthus]BAM18320.1 similar to CG10527 [Papilio xuthus]